MSNSFFLFCYLHWKTSSPSIKAVQNEAHICGYPHHNQRNTFPRSLANSGRTSHPSLLIPLFGFFEVRPASENCPCSTYLSEVRVWKNERVPSLLRARNRHRTERLEKGRALCVVMCVMSACRSNAACVVRAVCFVRTDLSKQTRESDGRTDRRTHKRKNGGTSDNVMKKCIHISIGKARKWMNKKR